MNRSVPVRHVDRLNACRANDDGGAVVGVVFFDSSCPRLYWSDDEMEWE